MSNLTENQQKSVTPSGGMYVATNYLSWSMGKTPWEAMGELDLNYQGIRPKVGTNNYNKWTGDVSLYYIPDAEKWGGMCYYTPVDDNDVPIGILLYGTNPESENNQKIAHSHMTKGADAILSDPENLPIR